MPAVLVDRSRFLSHTFGRFFLRTVAWDWALEFSHRRSLRTAPIVCLPVDVDSYNVELKDKKDLSAIAPANARFAT